MAGSKSACGLSVLAALLLATLVIDGVVCPPHTLSPATFLVPQDTPAPNNAAQEAAQDAVQNESGGKLLRALVVVTSAHACTSFRITWSDARDVPAQHFWSEAAAHVVPCLPAMHSETNQYAHVLRRDMFWWGRVCLSFRRHLLLL